METTYSLSLITIFLAEKDISFEFHTKSLLNNHKLEDGVRALLSPHVSLSVQTNPLIVDSSFAETAILVKDPQTQETDVIHVLRIDTPQELFTYIERLAEHVV